MVLHTRTNGWNDEGVRDEVREIDRVDPLPHGVVESGNGRRSARGGSHGVLHERVRRVDSALVGLKKILTSFEGKSVYLITDMHDVASFEEFIVI